MQLTVGNLANEGVYTNSGCVKGKNISSKKLK